MDTTAFGPECEAIAHVSRKDHGLELRNVEIRQPDREKPTFVPGSEFGSKFDKQSDVIEAIAKKMAGARVTIADVISDKYPIVIPYTD